MAAKPQAGNGTLRKLVREILATAPGYEFTDAMLCRGVRELLPANAAQDSDILEAAVWNLSNDYVVTGKDEDTEDRTWKITKHGLAKQQLA